MLRIILSTLLLICGCAYAGSPVINQNGIVTLAPAGDNRSYLRPSSPYGMYGTSNGMGSGFYAGPPYMELWASDPTSDKFAIVSLMATGDFIGVFAPEDPHMTLDLGHRSAPWRNLIHKGYLEGAPTTFWDHLPPPDPGNYRLYAEPKAESSTKSCLFVRFHTGAPQAIACEP